MQPPPTPAKKIFLKTSRPSSRLTLNQASKPPHSKGHSVLSRWKALHTLWRTSNSTPSCLMMKLVRICSVSNKPGHYPTIGIVFTGASKMAQVGGSMITASKEACRLGFLDWSPRLKMAMYSCDIQASSSCYQEAEGRYTVI